MDEVSVSSVIGAIGGYDTVITFSDSKGAIITLVGTSHTILRLPSVSGSISSGAASARGSRGFSGFDGEDGESVVPLPGSRGPVGPTGLTGSIGPRGLSGFDGEDGESPVPMPGKRGSVGPTGSRGYRGLSGFDGEDGEPVVSIPGKRGLTGLRGYRGLSGSDGEDGEPVVSIPGKLGPTGLTGSTGSTGPRGLSGFDGEDGESVVPMPGYRGPVGPTGSTGSTGARGYRGLSGFDGEDGETPVPMPGYRGPVGPTGLTGSTGSTGPRGLSGFDGEDGETPVPMPGKRGPAGGSGSMTYPGVGIPVSTGSAWDTSIGLTGAYTFALTLTANTALALPTEGTLVTALAAKNYSIKHDGTGDYATLATAIAALSAQAPIGGVTLTLDAGVHAYSAAIAAPKAYGQHIAVAGATPTSTTITSVQSSSGSAGARSIVLNVASEAGISTSDYALISGTANGASPTYLEGCWPITNVDAVNHRITISTTHKAASAPSGAITGTFKALHTVITCTACSGFTVWDDGSVLNIGNVAIVGDGTTAGTAGISIARRGYTSLTADVGVYGFATGVSMTENAQIYAASPIVLAASNGYDAATGGVYMDIAPISDVNYLICSGCAGAGLYLSGGAYSRTPTITASGNSVNGINNSGSSCGGTTLNGTGNTGYGYYSLNGARPLLFTTKTYASNSVASASSDTTSGLWSGSGTLFGSFSTNSTSAASPGFSSSSDSSTGMAVPTAGDLRLVAGGTSTVRVTATGLGLGLSGAPTATLDIIGSTRLRTATTLPGSPQVGMEACVSTATTPAIGSVLSLGGATFAKAIYNGTQWTVIGI
jgi:collagen type VII alpha